jgi:hypothetical protein
MKKKKFLKLVKLHEYIVKYKTINRSLGQRIKFNKNLTEEFKEELRNEQKRNSGYIYNQNSGYILSYRKEFIDVYYNSPFINDY